MSEEWDIALLCLVVIVYLGFFDFDSAIAQKLDFDGNRFQRPAHMLVLIQQTVQFSDMNNLGEIVKDYHGCPFPFESLKEW